MGSVLSHGKAAQGPDVTKYFGSKNYYEGELLKDQRYRHDEDLETLTVTLSSGDDIIMWSYAIDVRACNDLPKRGFNEKDDYVVFHYTDKEGFGKITSSRTVWASMSPQIDSNFGFGVYSSCKAPHQWRSKKEIFINNFFPSKKDWEQRKHLDFEEWPSLEALKFNKPGLSDRELNELLNTPFGNAVLKKWEPTRKCDFCVPIVCDYHCAQDVMRKDTFANNMDSGKTRRAGYNKFEEEEPKWRDVWTVLKFEKTALQQLGRWELQMCNASQPAGLILAVQQRRHEAQADARAAAYYAARDKTILEAAKEHDLPAVRGFLREDPAAAHLCLWHANGCTALHPAAQCGHVDVCEVLLAAAADPNATDYAGWTPLHGAAEMGHAEAVRCLLAAKAKLNMQSEKGITPLHKAAQWSLMRRSQEVIQLLLAAEAAVDMKDAAGHTPLHLAVHMRCEDAVRLLLAAKAAVDIKNNWRETALDLAKQKGVSSIIEMLENASS